MYVEQGLALVWYLSSEYSNTDNTLGVCQRKLALVWYGHRSYSSIGNTLHCMSAYVDTWVYLPCE